MSKSILIVEDDATERVILENFLRNTMHLHAYTAENGRVAMDILSDKQDKIKLVISDYQMPVMDGLTLLEKIRSLNTDIPFIMLTGATDMNLPMKAVKAGATDFITKPFDKERMIVTIYNALRMRAMGDELSRLQDTSHKRGQFLFRHIIGADRDLSPVISTARKAALTDLPVLILGETGTGKELLAKAIHGESNRHDAPFVTVNCGAIPSELVESTLFGHEKGAFTGATAASIGKFREADGGTIFLDEIGELPLSAQVKLLRVLQENEVEPVGAPRSVSVNVRVISATHRKLQQDVRTKRFREDLYYRLNVLPLTLPPLRKRPHDIEPLVAHFLEKIALRTQMPVKSIDRTVLSAMRQYSWPGNVREMENMINRAFVLSEDNHLMMAQFDFSTISPSVSDGTNQNTPNIAIKTVAEMERDLMLAALEKCFDNITQASAMIGMAKSTFYRKMREFNISRKNHSNSNES